MNKNEKNSIKKYDSIAADYDKTFDGRFTAKFKMKILKLCEVPNGSKALDVGCGNGSLINAISKNGNMRGFGIDISPNMIEECRKRYKNITFEVSSGENLNFSYDSLYYNDLLRFTPPK